MKCEQAMNLMDNYLDSELPPDHCDQFQEHLAHCQSCSGSLHSFQSLKGQAVSLPRTITPQRDLWPEISYRLVVAEFPKRFPEIEPDLHKSNWRSIARFWPWIAAAVLCCTLSVFFSIRSSSRQLGGEAAKLSSGLEIGKAAPGQNKKEVPAALLNVTPQQRAKPGTGLNPQSMEYIPGYRAYMLNVLARVFVSNSGSYAVYPKFDPSFHPEFGRVLRFEPDGTVSSWEPNLPYNAGVACSVYPGSGDRLWLSYETVDARYAAFCESNFGATDPPRELARLSSRLISQFAVGPQGAIYAIGEASDPQSSAQALSRGQSASSQLVHVVDPKSGRQIHLKPLTFQFNFENLKVENSNWQNRLFPEMTFLPSIARISIRSNGNFFLSVASAGQFFVIKEWTSKEAVEFSQEGQVVRRWDLNISEQDARIGNILVDIDDSLIIEVTYPDAAVKPDPKSGAPMHRYFLRMNTSGTRSRYDDLIPDDETVIGWIGETREMVTKGDATKQGMMEIRFRKLPI